MNKGGGIEFIYTKKWIIIILLAALLATSVAIYLTFFNMRECGSYECYQKAMRECKRYSYISDQFVAAWEYKIKGDSFGYCDVEVTLLEAKEGELTLERLKGYDMLCTYKKGIVTYPEKNLANCHGRLKEELQSIMIDKLHRHILENIGQINESLNSAV